MAKIKIKTATRKAQVFDAHAFGLALKSKRTIQNNYTIRDVADILNIPNSTISRIENDKPTELSSILVVCDWIGKSLCDIIVLKKVKAFPIIFQDGIIVLKKNSKAAKFLKHHTLNKENEK